MAAKYTLIREFTMPFRVTMPLGHWLVVLIGLASGCRKSGEASAEKSPGFVDGSSRKGGAASVLGDAGASGDSGTGKGVAPPASVDLQTGSCPTEPGAPSVKSKGDAFTIFVSVDRTRTIPTATDDVPYQKLCIARGVRAPEVLLEGRGAVGDTPPDKILASFDHLVLSQDEKSLYFSSSAWVTSACIHRLDLETKKEVSLGDGEPIRMLESGPYKGELLALHFRLDPVYRVDSPKYRGRMEIWSVLSQEGKTLRTLPDDEKAREKLLASWSTTSDRNTDPKTK